MARIAVIGKEEFGLGFMLAGVKDVYVDNDIKETEDLIMKMIEDEKVGIIVIQQETFDDLPVKVQEDLTRLVKPVILTLSKEGDVGRLREMIIKSIGVDLWNDG